MKKLCIGLNESAKIIHENNKAKGFWDKERNVGEMLMLVVTELSEAMESHRKNKIDFLKSFNQDMNGGGLSIEDFDSENINYGWIVNRFETTVKDSFWDEIADTFIRLLDLCAGLGIDIETHIQLKVEYEGQYLNGTY